MSATESTADCKDTPVSEPSLLHGTETIQLWRQTLGQLIDDRAVQFGAHFAAVFPEQNRQLSYEDLSQKSRLIAKGFLESGLKHGDCIGIMAGNRYEYLEAFFGAARIGCPYVVLNTTYTPQELVNALSVSSCKCLLIAPRIGSRSLSSHIAAVHDSSNRLPKLKKIVLLPGDTRVKVEAVESIPYKALLDNGLSIFMNDSFLRHAESRVAPEDVVNLQFTSGTTGSPKAAMLTHVNIINNGRFVGSRMGFTPDDVICCPPPLFHCFGLVMGLLGSLVHGSTIVFPSEQFDAYLTLEAIATQKCTSLYGVPTMFIAVIEARRKREYAITSLRTGLAAGAPVPANIARDLERIFNIKAMQIAYGMTETSPVTFMTNYNDTEIQRTRTVGTILPHTQAKVVDCNGNIVPRGTPGELCTSGYALQKGYWENAHKTAEVMKVDDDGRRWMHTGDECIIDNDGYCIVTGRIKDIIIRGGENIFPQEIEDRLIEHESICEASVVGIKDSKYGEVVGCFLRQREETARPNNKEIIQWVMSSLGAQKAPRYVFWVGDREVGPDFPKTGSGKHQKHLLRALGNSLVDSSVPKSKL